MSAGTNGQILSLSSGKPTWTNAPSTTSTTNLSITNNSGTTLNVSSNASNAVSVTGGISANSLALTTALPVTSGGTGIASVSTGDLIYASASNTLGSLTAGTDGQILSLSSGKPAWTNAPSTTSTTNLNITNGSGTTLNVSSNASNAVSVTGGITANSLALTTALPVTSGGTGIASIYLLEILFMVQHLIHLLHYPLVLMVKFLVYQVVNLHGLMHLVLLQQLILILLIQVELLLTFHQMQVMQLVLLVEYLRIVLHLRLLFQ